MDTRTKIGEPGSIPRGRPVKILVSWLDPLWSEQVAALRRFASADAILVVAVDDPPDPLLPLRARAELAAALSFVDWVIVGADGVSSIPDAEIIDLRSEDRDRRGALQRHILRRHGSE